MTKKGDKRSNRPAGMLALLGEDEIKRLEKDVVEVKPAVLETERVLNAETPQIIRDIIRHVQDCKKDFVTPDHVKFAPVLPKGIDFEYMVPVEVTDPRERPYFIDIDGVLRRLDCDVRQQQERNGRYKQTTKVGKGGTAGDSTMDRMEQASRVLSFGFNVFAIGDKEVRSQILKNVTSLVKPGLRMVSQRVRIPYHPEGNEDLLIEMALEPLHFGQTFTGFWWQNPKIDLEIKYGPKEKAVRHAILAREERRLMDTFPLTRQLQSSPTPGFEEIEDALRNPDRRRQFEKMGVSEQWWKEVRIPAGAALAAA